MIYIPCYNTLAMDKTTEKLDKGKLLPLLLTLIVPAVISQLITFLYNIVDRIYVSHIEDGMNALAALGVVLPITLIIQAFGNLIGLGGSPRATMKIGQNDLKEANHIFNTSFILLFALGVIISLVGFFFAEEIVVLFGCPSSAVAFATEYLQIYSLGSIFVLLSQGLNPFITALGHSFAAMISILIGAILNIGLDPLFIFVFNMGVKGAALSTVISQAISFVWIVLFFFSKNSIFHFKFKGMPFSFKRCFSILSLGFSPFIMTLTECAIQIVFNINLNAATGGNKDYTAALTITLSALQLISLPLNGIGYGVQPFVSYTYAKGNSVRLKKGILLTTLIAFGFTIIAYSISMSAPVIYAKLFGASETVEAIVVKYAPFFLMGSVMFFVQMTLQNINVALGQALSALLLAVNRKIVIMIPLCFILTHFLGFEGVYLSEGVTDFVAGFITSIVFLITFPKIFKRCDLNSNKETSLIQ